MECALAFVLLPLAVALGRHGPWPELPVIPTLLVLGAAAVALLVREEGFDLRREFTTAVSRAELQRIVRRFGVLGLSLTVALAVLQPERLFEFPRREPALWLMVMFGYPILSVVPQELVFRTFFFQRYAEVFGRGLVLASALVFGWVHVVFWNVPAVALTIIGGLLFAATYRRTRIAVGRLHRARALRLPRVHDRAWALLLRRHRRVHRWCRLKDRGRSFVLSSRGRAS